MIRTMIFWFCVPWALFFGLGGSLYLFRNPEKLLWLLPIIVLIGFASRAEYRRIMAAAEKPENKAVGKDLQPFNPRGPGQFTSFSFRHGLPPGFLQGKRPPLKLPPPAGDS